MAALSEIPKVSDRPQFRITDEATRVALALFIEDKKARDTSDAMRIAIRKMIPQKYFDEAVLKLRSQSPKSRKGVAK